MLSLQYSCWINLPWRLVKHSAQSRVKDVGRDLVEEICVYSSPRVSASTLSFMGHYILFMAKFFSEPSVNYEELVMKNLKNWFENEIYNGACCVCTILGQDYFHTHGSIWYFKINLLFLHKKGALNSLISFVMWIALL